MIVCYVSERTVCKKYMCVAPKQLLRRLLQRDYNGIKSAKLRCQYCFSVALQQNAAKIAVLNCIVPPAHAPLP
jgi:hypothetical protein